ncbi:hypothetical protein Tco_0379172 [Tanacetum coccineum]
MENPYLTMEEYIELEAEKARRHGQAFNWETATYGKVSYFDDFDYLKDFENELPSIVYDGALMSGPKISSEPMVSPLNDDRIDFRISFDESDDEDYIVIFTVMAHLPVRAQRYLWLRYEVEGYTEEIVYDFEGILDTIFGRQVNRVHILDFKGLTEEMRETLTSRLRMVYTRTEGHVLMSDTELGLDVADTLCFQLGGARRGMTWRQFILALGLHTEEMALRHTSQAPEKVTATDLFYLRSMDEGMVVNVPYLLAQYLFRHTEGRKHRARMSGGYFIGRLLWLEPLKVLRVAPTVDEGVPASGPKRQPVAAAEAPKGVEGSPVVDEGVQAILAPL